MPSFRGEDADERHLCQFYHSEAEIIGNLESVIKLIEDYIHFLCKALLSECATEIINIAGTDEHIKSVLSKTEFPRVTYDEAIEQLSDVKGALKIDKENGFVYITSIGEKELIQKNNGIVWLINMDKAIVPFYQASQDSIHAKCADLLFGVGETVGCGERHKTGEEVRKALLEHQVNEEPYSWYIQMKEKYPLQTAGFGMGTERFILWLLKQNDIRDCQLLPRFNGEIFIP